MKLGVRVGKRVGELIDVVLDVKAEHERHDVVLLVLGTPIVVDVLGWYALPLGAARRLDERRHALAVQRLGLAEVDHVEDDSLSEDQQNIWLVCFF